MKQLLVEALKKRRWQKITSCEGNNGATTVDLIVTDEFI